jgi:hypothetical protein
VCSSGVILDLFLFFAILVEQVADSPDIDLDVREQPHDSRDIAVLDRRLDGRIVSQNASLYQ